MQDILDVALLVAETLERLEVPYLVGGSLASSLHGLPRATQDVDLVAALTQRHVSGLVSALESEFYLDRDAIRDAIERRTSFNVIHLETLLKVDVFVLKRDPASTLEMERRQRYVITDDPVRELVVASPEDVIVQKLYWFALGDEMSERQWSDALGVLKVVHERLDLPYLRRAAALLGVAHLLERILRDAGMTSDDGSPS